MNENALAADLLRVNVILNTEHTIARTYFDKLDWPWDALPLIKAYVSELAKELDLSEFEVRPGNVFIHKTAQIAPSALIGTDVIIGARTEVRHCAFIRGPAIVGEDAIVGNSTEIKNSILFDEAKAPHFNYVGDSILGYNSHFGAGVITSNVKSDYSLVSVTCGDERISTDLKKFGAIAGDNVEIGCNAVLNPGTVIGPNSNIYPLSMVRGYIPPNSIYKKHGDIVEKY